MSIFCTDIITKDDDKIYAWSVGGVNLVNVALERKIAEIHFSNGKIFKYDGLSTLSSELSWYLLKNNFKPWGSRYRNSAIIELRSFPFHGYKLDNLIEFESKKVITVATDMTFTDLLVLKKQCNNLGAIPETVNFYRPLNSLFDIILAGELKFLNVSTMYGRQGDIITVNYSNYNYTALYEYKYRITDLDKFKILLTKINIQYSKNFQTIPRF